MTTAINDKVILQNGVAMPWLGLGVFQVEDGSVVVNSVKDAIKNGYRSIDTAAIYDNEAGVGQGIREAIAEHGVTREKLFITSKVWNADLGYESTLAAFETSLNKLGLDYLDLYLIHWPVEGKYKDAWRALETLYKQGRVKAIGVSNFHVHHLQDLMKDAEIMPMVDQVEYHPMLAQHELRAFTREHNIQLEAWSPLMQGQLLDHPVLSSIASKHGKSVAQVIIRWDLQNGVVTIPKSIKESRIIENGNVFDFELSADEMAQIDALNEDKRVGPDPDNFDF
ncbi:Aldo/keto reductase [Paenibacillus catalpae]|uniref:Aldo/keto reductase n=1 Tax=Paenibacillus catalpae TaxID=1045775 RepID=A0A1I2E0K5_9BACL|nr:aldo/keto reductase [Paenibacillus catalpae]SFE86207.1 Aldo/keto reductase [Paenibacillus catalpae]